MTYTARKNEIVDADGKQIAVVMPSKCSKKEACGMAEIIATYDRLHTGKLGAHWLWVVIEQIAAGVPEDEALREFDYYEKRPVVVARETQNTLHNAACASQTEHNPPAPGEVEQAKDAGWRDIESAPKSIDRGDGRVQGVYLLGFCPDPDTCNLDSAVCVVWWEPYMKKGNGMWYGEGGFEVFPTHWQPLARAPTDAAPPMLPGKD